MMSVRTATSIAVCRRVRFACAAMLGQHSQLSAVGFKLPTRRVKTFNTTGKVFDHAAVTVRGLARRVKRHRPYRTSSRHSTGERTSDQRSPEGGLLPACGGVKQVTATWFGHGATRGFRIACGHGQGSTETGVPGEGLQSERLSDWRINLQHFTKCTRLVTRRCEPSANSVSESHEAVAGEVQTRSRAGVVCMILTQVLREAPPTHRGPPLPLRSKAGGTGAVLGGERAVVRYGEVRSALLMPSKALLIVENAFAAMNATSPIENCGNCSRSNASRSCGALVSESDEAVPGEVQTRSRTRVAGVIRAQVLVQCLATHKRASAASLRPGTGARCSARR